jgi:hypothetical protein
VEAKVRRLKGDWGRFAFCAVEFDQVLPVVAAGAFQPEIDFHGRQLQLLARDAKLDHIVSGSSPVSAAMSWQRAGGGWHLQQLDTHDGANGSGLDPISLPEAALPWADVLYSRTRVRVPR